MAALPAASESWASRTFYQHQGRLRLESFGLAKNLTCARLSFILRSLTLFERNLKH